MARRLPGSLDSFRLVNGVGKKKLEDFGEEFVSVILQHCAEHNLASDCDPAPAKPRESKPEKETTNSSSIAAFSLFEQRLSVAEVAKRMQRAESTVTGYLNDYLKHRQVTDPSPWVEAAIIKRVEAAISRVGSERLKPIFLDLNEEISYDMLRIVATCWNNRTTPPQRRRGLKQQPGQTLRENDSNPVKNPLPDNDDTLALLLAELFEAQARGQSPDWVQAARRASCRGRRTAVPLGDRSAGGPVRASARFIRQRRQGCD